MGGLPDFINRFQERLFARVTGCVRPNEANHPEAWVGYLFRPLAGQDYLANLN